MQIRPYRLSDAAALAEIFHQGVQIGAAGHYSQAERDAWSPEVPETGRWAERLDGQTVLVGENAEGPQGFMSIWPNGYLDFAYVRPAQRGTGLADLLLERITELARAQGNAQMTTRASLVARSFFARNGWAQTGRQEIDKDGVVLVNFNMARSLS